MIIMKPTKEYKGRSTIRMWNCDFMQVLKDVPDNHYDLVLTDPPYGISFDGNSTVKGKGGKASTFSDVQHHEKKEWDSKRPDSFDLIQLKRKNQIIWGGNYFADLLPASRGWIYWDKKITNENNTNFSDGELAWTSFEKRLIKFTYDWIGFGYLNNKKRQKKIHPTEKPIQLHKMVFNEYAEQGQTIFDGYGGSMSIAIACWDLGFDLDICELDTDYFNDAVKRFEQHISQTQLF